MGTLNLHAVLHRSRRRGPGPARSLRSLVGEKRLVRLGYGVYGRAVVSRLCGAPILNTVRTDFGLVLTGKPEVTELLPVCRPHKS